MSGYEFVSCRSANDQRLPAGPIATSLVYSLHKYLLMVTENAKLMSLISWFSDISVYTSPSSHVQIKSWEDDTL